MKQKDICHLIKDEKEFNAVLKEKNDIFIDFYASWCPYSQRFLPLFLESAEKCPQCHMRVLADDNEELADKYKIEIYPTVTYFRNGKLSGRLDGIAHQGLNAAQLKEFIDKSR